MNRIKSRLRDYIIGIVIGYVVIGGNCGLCGEWVDHCLVSRYCHFTICDKCSNETRHHVSIIEKGEVTARYVDGEKSGKSIL